MEFLNQLKNRLIRSGLTEDEHLRVERAMHHLNSAGYDPWGVNPETLKASLASSIWLYRKYFRVETTGLENIPAGRLLVIGNHGGQLPFDGMLIAVLARVVMPWYYAARRSS